MKAKIKKTQDGIEKNLNALIERSSSLRAFLQFYVYPKYQSLQRSRWMTEGASQGKPWPSLNAKYAEWKKKKYAKYEGQGQRMLVATGHLYKSVIGPGSGHYKKIDDKSITVGTSVEYAKYVAAKRSIFIFKKQDMDEIKQSVWDYIRFAKYRKFVRS
jgi:hypothetical protein